MAKLNTVEKIVEKVLDEKVDARKNDDILYLYVCEHFEKDASSKSLEDFLKNRSKTSCPNFASVTRARRKVFEKRPELRPFEITKIRSSEEKEYIDYALSS